MSFDFSFNSHGKWILTGEHAVLRGGAALVFPTPSTCMHFDYKFIPSSPLSVNFAGSYGQEAHLLFWGVLEDAIHRLGIDRSQLMGQLSVHSDIPIGSGLGASAALCAGVARWLQHLDLVAGAEVYEFARQLENLFHGESSGVDIAVALRNEPLVFWRHKEPEQLEVNWKPSLYLSNSGVRGVTLECVGQVKKMLDEQPQKGRAVDEQMGNSVELALQALKSEPAKGVELLKQAMDLGLKCFEQWGLVEGALKEHIESIKKRGALAVKPTGSGGGGHVISLWPQDVHLDGFIRAF